MESTDKQTTQNKRLQNTTFNATIDTLYNKGIKMAKSIKLSDKLVTDATIYAKSQHRTPPKQIEHWARIGKIAEENPDLTMGFVNDVLIGLAQAKEDDTSEYQFE